MSDSLDDENGDFLVLVNDDGQHSLWPALANVPTGWMRVGPRSSRSSCLAYVRAQWTDLTPTRLRPVREQGTR